jgi:hypothetical protein
VSVGIAHSPPFCAGKPHTAEYLLAIVRDMIAEAESQFGVQVVCVATDNASNVKSMREQLHAEKPLLMYIGCQAHWLNLLLCDLASESVILTYIVS